MRLIAGLLLAILCVPMFAQNAPSGWVLLPIFTGPLAGAYESVWATEFAMRNAGSSAARWQLFVTPGSIPIFGFGVLQPGTLVREVPLRDSTRGHLLLIDRPQIDEFVFSLRARDLTRQARSAGVELPVVRESEFRQRIELIDVPTDERFRHSLRVYEPTARRDLSVRVKCFAQGSNETSPLVEFVLPLAPATESLQPAQGDIHNLTSAHPSLRNVERIRVEIEPLQPEMKIWAFLTITNNETQELTAITPQ